MRFPDQDRVIYERNPLVEVICQIRFPRNLEIESQLPIEFQKLISIDFPLLETRETVAVQIPKESAPAEGSRLPYSRSTIFDFATLDKNWKVSLGSDFVALACGDYRMWDEFQPRIRNIIDVTVGVYSPPTFTRIGLRYKNMIDRVELELSEEPWRELLSEHIVGILAYEDVPEEDIASCDSTIIMQMDEGIVAARHGLYKNTGTGELAYGIDNDFFVQTETGVSVDDTNRLLNEFNADARRLFRWCIRDKLHIALRPEPIPD
jgi:uncharacterized protein (TIGR04255 family)